jgi:hypothetical protein
MVDPDVAALLHRLADLHELEWRRISLPPDSPERDAIDREIVVRSHRILAASAAGLDEERRSQRR